MKSSFFALLIILSSAFVSEAAEPSSRLQIVGWGDWYNEAKEKTTDAIQGTVKTYNDAKEKATDTIQGGAESYQYLREEQSKLDASFGNVYSNRGWISLLTSPVAVGVYTAVAGGAAAFFVVSTAGSGGAMLAAAGPYITSVGGMVGTTLGVGSGAPAAGLAVLGGGTLSSGGFGIAGGAAVVSAITGFGTGVSTDIALGKASDMINQDPYSKYQYVKVPLSEKGTDRIVELVTRYKEYEEKLINAKDSQAQVEIEKVINNVIRPELQKRLTEEPEHQIDYVNRGILLYNMGNYKEAEKQFRDLLTDVKKPSFLRYMLALTALASEGTQKQRYNAAMMHINKAIEIEPDALEPYLIGMMISDDFNRTQKVLHLANQGIDDIGDSFEIAWVAGESLFENEKHEKSIDFFHIAQKKAPNKAIEAESALYLALAYKNTGDVDSGLKWVEDARGLVEDKNLKIEYYKRFSDGTLYD